MLEYKQAFEKYFDEHNTGMLYTGDKIYKIDFLYFEIINAYSKVYSLTLKRNGIRFISMPEWQETRL